MAWYVYKCNGRNEQHQNHYGDWKEFFEDTSDGKSRRWGTPDVVSALAKLEPGDKILAYQTDRNSLMGVVVVGGWDELEGRAYVSLRPIIRLGREGVQVRPMKVDERIAEINAFKTREVKTLYDISPADAEYIIEAAKSRCNI
jgi:hypothetical protein